MNNTIQYKIYRYGDDNINDSGWGCSYRNIQTILSCYKKYYNKNIDIPVIQEIVSFFKKNIDSENIRDLWIEPLEVSTYLNFFDSNFKGKHIAYVINNHDFSKILKTDILFYFENERIVNDFNDVQSHICEHFKNTKFPIIIDDGMYSYCFIIENDYILLIDPHRKETNIQKKNIDFLKNRFWLFYFPRIL